MLQSGPSVDHDKNDSFIKVNNKVLRALNSVFLDTAHSSHFTDANTEAQNS